MKKLRIFLLSFLLLFALTFTGCGEKNTEPTLDNKEIFEEELKPLSKEELAKLEDTSLTDEDMKLLDETALDNLDDGASDGEETESPSDRTEADYEEENGGIQVEEDGTYTSKEEISVYIHRYQKLPSNYITKKEAQKLGWDSSKGNLEEVAPGRSIGGDRFGNYDKMLPEEKERKYFECDIDFDGGFRNAKRIVYSDDGLIFYTEDHYKTFEQLY